MFNQKIRKMAMALMTCFFLLPLSGCSSGSYSEEQHIQRVRERAEERFLGEDSEYTGLEVYPIYNEYDELKYMLIELEPQGFLYVRIEKDSTFEWLSGVGMYLCSSIELESWMPYRVKEGVQEVIEVEEGQSVLYKNREFYRDENGDVIVYRQSHFKVAGIENERRYLLEIRSTITNSSGTDALIPAVKRGDQYLDLVDGALIDYTPDMESSTYAVEFLYFIPKPDFNL